MPVAAFALLVAFGLWCFAAPMPFLSESYTLLEAAARQDSWTEVFALELDPYRPLQYLVFWLFAHLGVDEPAIARIPAHVLHAGCIVLVDRLARRMHLGRHARWIAVVAFASFPSVAGLYWVGGISTPARAFLLLGSLLCAIRHAEAPCPRSGIALLSCMLLALGFHEMAVVGPPLVLAWIAVRRSERGDGSSCVLPTRWTENVVRALRDPWVLGVLSLGASYAVFASIEGANNPHPFAAPAAMAANATRAALCFAPKPCRLAAIDALRGGGAHAWFGVFLVVFAIAALGVVARASGRRGRVLLFGAGLDLLLPAITAGFVIRYAYFAAALLALALGLAVERAVGVRRVVWQSAVGILVAAWLLDTVRHVREHRDAGRIVRELVDQAAAARARWPEREIAVVDAPAMWGSEKDVVVCNWGLPQALTRRGVAGPFRFLRATASWTASDHEVMTADELVALGRARSMPVVAFDAATGSVTTTAPIE